MKSPWLPALRVFLLLTVVTGILYPLAMTLIAQVFFPHTSGGSVIVLNGSTVGSELVAQKFDSNRYFQPRPSAVDYQPTPSGGSNFGPTSVRQHDAAEQRRAEFISRNHLPTDTAVPPDMLSASGSGIDPHISPDAAMLQIIRIAEARGWDAATVRRLTALVQSSAETPQLGILGERRVNVLRLNLALDAFAATVAHTPEQSPAR